MCRGGDGGNVANVQVLPVSSVANFQLSEGCRGARGGQKRPLPEVRRVGVRGRVRPRFFVGCGRLSTAAKMAAPHTSLSLTLDIGTENRKTIEKHRALWHLIAVNCINSDRSSFVL